MRPARSRPAPGYRPKMGGPNSSALCIALIRTFQNLRHLLTGASAGPSTCHFRFLLLELSLPNAGPVPEGTSAVAMATGAPRRRYWPHRPGRPPTPRPPQPRALHCPNPTGNEERLENSSCSHRWCCPTRHSSETQSWRPDTPTPRRSPRCEESISGIVVPGPALCVLHAGTCSPGRGAWRDPALSGGLSRDSDFPSAPLRALPRCCVVLCARLLGARFYYYLGYSATGGLRFRRISV